MINQLRMQNFKGWKDTGCIKFAPLTLFFGANSSGKSSIGQFLMMLKQTVDSPDRKAVFFPGNQNSVVQLGSYKEMVHQRNIDNKIKFNYTWSFNNISFEDPITLNQYSGDVLRFEAEVGLMNQDQISLSTENFMYEFFKGDTRVLSIGMKKKGATSYDIVSSNYDLKRKAGRPWDPDSIIRFYGFPNEVAGYHQNADFVQEINLAHEKLFQSMYYLRPIRTNPERFYPWSGIKPESVGATGENTIPALLAARKRRISYKKNKKAYLFEEVIAQKLQQMGLIDKFSVAPVSEQRQEYEVKIRTKGSKDSVDLPDVGFGISQVLPVLVECFYAPHNSIIIMEQPEIHLHPSAQAALADALIDVIYSREDGKDRNIQLIIETHSEHFLRRIQRRVAENKIKNEDISVYFADASISPANLRPLEVDTFGNIKNWPENFFGDEIGDITAHAKAALEKRKGQIK